MAPFELNSATHFVSSSDGIAVEVYELMAKDESAVKGSDWKKVSTAITSLRLFGQNIYGQRLNNLAADLSRSRLMVNPQGNSYLDVTSSLSVDPSFGVEYYRLNDIFNWSRRHGVTPRWPQGPTADNIWSRRSDMQHGGTLVDYRKELDQKDEEYTELKAQIDSIRAEARFATGELERCRQWQSDFRFGPTILSGPRAAEGARTRGQDVDPSTFRVLRARPAGAFRRAPSFGYGGGGHDVPFDGFTLVDQDVAGLPAPPTVRVWCEDGLFDTQNWRYVKARGQKNLANVLNVVLVYYDGIYQYKEVQNERSGKSERVPMPYKPGVEFAADTNLDLVYSPMGDIRVAFAYRW
ncbi:unnamed protein product [Linum tenue]|uniref:Uncharacterized protein n=1 Tax=Linum tenue TaxID=586396 RepID=A0AAV0NAJ5_9ROSI|nr:unnamed protein product [Linum tenue]